MRFSRMAALTASSSAADPEKVCAKALAENNRTAHASNFMNAPYAVRMDSDLSPEIAACAAASRAMGTRYGEQET